MPFNSATYKMNKYRKEAYARLANARDIKARVAAGTAYDWEARRICTMVLLARNSMKLFLIARRLQAIDRETRRIVRGGR